MTCCARLSAAVLGHDLMAWCAQGEDGGAVGFERCGIESPHAQEVDRCLEGGKHQQKLSPIYCSTRRHYSKYLAKYHAKPWQSN